jgi:hypothetical protein
MMRLLPVANQAERTILHNEGISRAPAAEGGETGPKDVSDSWRDAEAVSDGWRRCEMIVGRR